MEKVHPDPKKSADCFDLRFVNSLRILQTLQNFKFMVSPVYVCPARLRRNGATQLDPQHHKCFPSPVPRAGYMPSTLLLLDTHEGLIQYECGRMKPLL